MYVYHGLCGVGFSVYRAGYGGERTAGEGGGGGCFHSSHSSI